MVRRTVMDEQSRQFQLGICLGTDLVELLELNNSTNEWEIVRKDTSDGAYKWNVWSAYIVNMFATNNNPNYQ